ncbi:hypothetical protein [Paraliomyxa miuraensis]|uniref:hypothetical protein n=1 Tax=Paraliomyxa miuraensis TaxID=376150 RepID=UPI00224E23EA|nr:hypothetical protein [Paraliomyxa miuraensis]MCX4245861.1 hypothetical protein [Paraliomyxa miuraensis]
MKTIIGLGLVLGLSCMAACDEDATNHGALVFRSSDGDLTPPPTIGLSIPNGLNDPSVSGLDTGFGLATNDGLDEGGGLLSTSAGRSVARYLVECALPPGDSITKDVGEGLLELHGLLGLAPEWKEGACDEDCQQWVSACLLARTNASGQEVWIWVTADHPAIGLGPSSAYPLYEATYFGNVLAAEPTRYACRGTPEGQAAAIANGRTCAEDFELCGITAYDDCVQHQRCIDEQGFYTECAEGATADGAVYPTISVFVSTPE